MESPTIQTRLTDFLTWFEGHIQKTKETEAQCRAVLTDSIDISVDRQLTIGRTCRELRECLSDAVKITHQLKAYHDRVGDIYELIAELEYAAKEGNEK